MSIATLMCYLIGEKKAIVDVAHGRSALTIGLLLVLSAGLAREYDHESLWHEPWHIVLPLLASLAVAIVLFVLVYAIQPQSGHSRPPVVEGLKIMIRLVWMTAPLAWLYAIPYERMLDSGSATQANLWTLAVVAGWRVILITRSIAVVTGVSAPAIFFIVMTVADAIVLTTLAIVPLPMMNIMGGIALSESESLIAQTSFTVVALGLLSGSVWLIGGIAAIATRKAAWVARSDAGERACARGNLGVACLVVISLGLMALPFTQPAQIRRYSVEQLLRIDKISDAIAVMSKHSKDDFPPHWDPPPRRAYRESRPDIVTIIDEIERQNAPNWVSQAFVLKLHDRARSELRSYRARESWPEIVKRMKEYDMADRVDEASSTLALILRVDTALAPHDRSAIEQLLDMIPVSDSRTPKQLNE